MALDALVINPRTGKVYQKIQESSNYPAIEPPYLAALTAEFIRNHGYQVKILDINAENLTTQEAAERIGDYSPKLAHIVVHGNQPSASTQLMPEVGALCKEVKQKYPDIKILLTGTHPSALPERTLLEEKCDFAARGEGFYTALELIKEIPLEDVSGLFFRKNGQIVAGKKDRIMDSKELDANFPTAAWDLLPMEKYRAHDWHSIDDIKNRQPYATIYTSFGCPFKCDFCCINSNFNDGGKRKNTIRYRSPELVVKEIENLVNKYGVRNIKFIDEMFVLHKSHYGEISQGLIDKGLGKKINIWAYARIDTIKEENLELLKDAGINWLVLGIESGSEHVRHGVEKGKFGQDDILSNVRKIQNAGIFVLGNYILGLPDDTEKSMQQTVDLAKELNCERPNFYCGMAYPGSKLHIQAQKGSLPTPSGWNKNRALLPEDKGGPGWIGYSQHAYETWPLPTANLYPEQVLAFRDKTIREYFRDETYVNMLQQKFGKETTELFCSLNSITPRRMILGD